MTAEPETTAINPACPWQFVKASLLALISLLLNFIIGTWAWASSLGLFDDLVTHYSPAMPLPVWRSLPFMAPTYLLVGALMELWSRRRWLVVVPVLASFFLSLGGAHTGTEYYPESLWDYLGRPSLSQSAIGLICTAFALGGWHAARVLWCRLSKRESSVVDGS